MRWTYLISRLLIVALVWGFVAYGMDPLLRYGSIQSLQSVTGAKADVGGIRTTFFPPSVTVRNLALASAQRPGWNMVEFDELHLGLEPSSLSRRRFVVEEGRLDGLRFDTPRGDDGQLENPPEPVSDEPSWMTEKLTELGSEWLTGLTEQVKAQLDPNVLETYRTGTAMYQKWDDRFQDLSQRAKAMRPKVEQLKIQFENAKKGDTFQQIEQYLQVSHRAEAIILEVRQFRDELKDIAPEVRIDFQTLNEARERDQEKVKHTLALLKPDARRISQALLGKTMYRQIQQVLTWVEAIREYQHELHDQVQPPRSAGHDFEFAVRDPAPDFLLKKLSLTGQISVNNEHIPFKAMLTDVTEDPKLLGRPCVMRLAADGSRPLQLRVVYDATGEVPVAEMLADFRDHNPLPLLAGKPREACLHATLSNLAWTTQLTLIKDRIEGSIDLRSDIGNLNFEASDNVRAEIVEAANEAFSTLQVLNASVKLGGTLRHPEIDLQSDVGEEIAAGVQLAFVHQLNKAKVRLLAEVDTYASDHIAKLTGRFKDEYQTLLTDNKELLEQINEVRTIVASLQSGKVDPETLIRQVTNSRLIPQKDQEKISRVMNEIDNTLQGRSLPGSLQEKIPQLPPGLLELPATLPRTPGFFPQTPSYVPQTQGLLPQTSKLFQGSEGLLRMTEGLRQTDSSLHQPIEAENTQLTDEDPPEEGTLPKKRTVPQTKASPTQPAAGLPQIPGFRSLLPKPRAGNQ